jgi:hypothetical protein
MACLRALSGKQQGIQDLPTPETSTNLHDLYVGEMLAYRQGQAAKLIGISRSSL